MTVGEYIEYLKKLNPEKGIWVRYDGSDNFAARMIKPVVEGIVSKDLCEYSKQWLDEDVEEGDYIINAG